MAEPSDAEVTGPVSPGIETAVYIDASALAKLYVPEAESERLDTFLRGRLGLMISELAITEVLSAVARRKREGELRPELANQIRGALLADADSGSFARLHLDPAVHRDAERPLLATDSLPLRTLDALHIALAFSGRATHVLTFDRRMREAAVQAGVNVIDISAQDAIVLHRSAVVLAVLGDLPAAIAREEKALALDPLSEEICRRLGFFFVANRQFAEARPLYEKALAIAPNSDRARFNLGDLDLLDNQPEQALASFRQTGIEELRLAGQAQAEYTLRHTDVSQRILEQLIVKFGKTSPAQIARVYAWRGEKNQAFEWAERACVQRDTGITWFKIDPGFRSLRADPRYKALLRKMNLPD